MITLRFDVHRLAAVERALGESFASLLSRMTPGPQEGPGAHGLSLQEISALLAAGSLCGLDDRVFRMSLASGALPALDLSKGAALVADHGVDACVQTIGVALGTALANLDRGGV